MKKLIKHTELKDGGFYVDSKGRVARYYDEFDWSAQHVLDYPNCGQWIAAWGMYREATDMEELRWRRAKEAE